jgi:hypothetical protein
MSGRIPVLCPAPNRIREFYLDSLLRRIADEAKRSGNFKFQIVNFKLLCSIHHGFLISAICVYQRQGLAFKVLLFSVPLCLRGRFFAFPITRDVGAARLRQGRT